MNNGSMPKQNLEIERRYLIRMPELSQADCELWEIVQTYLTAEMGETRRLRMRRSAGRTQYFYTKKTRISAMTSDEREREIGLSEYDALMREADTQLRSIHKRRYRIPYEGQILEIDIFNFWTDRAILEIELPSEEQAVFIPDWLDVIREITRERAYKNRYLAAQIPMEDIE